MWHHAGLSLASFSYQTVRGSHVRDSIIVTGDFDRRIPEFKAESDMCRLKKEMSNMAIWEKRICTFLYTITVLGKLKAKWKKKSCGSIRSLGFHRSKVMFTLRDAEILMF